MNKIQKDYAVAKAKKQVIKDAIDAAEALYIKEHGIVNPNGDVPEFLYMIDDSEVFAKACEDFENMHGDLLKESNACDSSLKKAENALIDWGLSIAPTDVRNTLEAHKNDYKYRDKLIDLAFRLDARTLPKRRELVTAE